MDHAKKMLLIEPSLIKNMNQYNNLHKVENSTSRLGTEMQNIFNSNIDDRKKCILYLQILQRYLQFTEKDREPLRVSINTPDSEDSNKNNNVNVKDLVATQTSNNDVKQLESSKIQRNPLYTTTHLLSLIPKKK